MITSKRRNKRKNKRTYKQGSSKRSSTSKRRSKRSSTSKGGRAIDAGTYGCVFDPAIKCANRAIPYNSKNISKLMYKEDSEAELIEMSKVKRAIEQIPNKENYFLITNTYACPPEKLTAEDLSQFDKKCRLFTKRDVNSSNINEKINLDELELIVMPNGGINIEKFIQRIMQLPEKEMYKQFVIMNEALIKLLVNGIVPMNARQFNHYDVKAGNILIGEDGHARLIDWGLAGENDGLHIPEAIQDRSIAFNMPFSDIFFDNFVKKWLPAELNAIKGSKNLLNKTTGQAELLKIVAVNMINESIVQTSEGHFDYITSNILHDIYKIYAAKTMYNRVDYNLLSTNVLIDYVHSVLLTYVDESGNFKDTAYFYEVFVKNVDIWGFLLAYIPIIEFCSEIFHPEIINTVCRILLKYCFSTDFAAKPINATELATELQSLSTIASRLLMKGTTNMEQNNYKANKMATNKADRRPMNKADRRPTIKADRPMNKADRPMNKADRPRNRRPTIMQQQTISPNFNN